MESSGIIGASIPRIDALDKVTGRSLYGADLTKEGPLFIADDGAAKPTVRRTVRIGVTSARDKRRRFVVAGNPWITRPRLA